MCMLPQERARQPPRDRIGHRDHAHADHAVDEYAIAREELLAVADHPPGALEAVRHPLADVGGEVVGDPAQATIGDRQPSTRDRLDEIVEKLARLEHVESRRDGADLAGPCFLGIGAVQIRIEIEGGVAARTMAEGGIGIHKEVVVDVFGNG